MSEGATQAILDSGQIFLCPFCIRECVVGWDCSCGAKAINSILWFNDAEPIMRHHSVSPDEVLFAAIEKRLHVRAGVQRMIPKAPEEKIP
jgi:hypothetical protein